MLLPTRAMCALQGGGCISSCIHTVNCVCLHLSLIMSPLWGGVTPWLICVKSQVTQLFLHLLIIAQY